MNERDKELAKQAWTENDWDGHVDIPKLIQLVRADAMETATRAANESWTLLAKALVLAEREALEAKDWTALMREGSLVTWGDAEELGERVRAAIRARGNK